MGAPLLSKFLQKVLFGTPWGTTYPARENPPPPAYDGRTVALRLLRRFITELTFYRANAEGQPPIPFQIAEKDIHIEWPDNEDDLVFPSIALLSTGPANYDMIGLTGYVEENTRDVYAPGTVVQWMNEYRENIVLEIWATKKSERRAILAGLEAALSPTEQMYGLRFTMPDYFNELVCFAANDREIIDDGEAVKNRRRARITLQMRFHQVALVNYNQLVTTTKVETDVDMDTELPIEVDTVGVGEGTCD
jgi:hypothetical protein